MPQEPQPETYVSVDVETAGPVPSRFSLLSIGACVAEDPEQGFYVELRPEHDAAEASALEVSGLTLAHLAEHGTAADQAMSDFAAWVDEVTPTGSRAVFVALNAPFDWMFVADAFARHLGRNPFGYSALDIKAYYMGLTGVPWSRTGMHDLGPAYLGGRELTHNALADARDQAEIFRALLRTDRGRQPVTDTPTAPDPIASIRDSARSMGMELDDAETARWLEEIKTAAAATRGDDITVDASGVFGHRISMLDFSPKELARFRRIGEVVEVTGPPGVVEGALALSGSAAQSKIQTHPGDADFFQRLNIIADTRDEACRVLAGLIREKAMRSPRGEGHQFIEAKWSSYPYDAVRDGQPVRKGSPITWKLDDITAGAIEVEADGETRVLDWDELASEPGWVKIDYVVVDPARHRLCNASNVVDVSWQSPDEEIVPLDGYLDAYFQEVYLDADELPVFDKIVRHVSGDALDEYVEQLEGEVRKYLTGHVNYGKAAKRMYNVFRLTGRHLDAAFVRELFDEPTTFLYQVWSLIGTLDNATSEGSGIPLETVRLQADELILKVVELLDGVAELEIVSALLELKHTLEGPDVDLRSSEVEGAKTHVMNLINTFFRDRLVTVPTIKTYMDSFGPAEGP